MKKALKLEWLRKLLGLPSEEEIAELRQQVAENQSKKVELTNLLAQREAELKIWAENKEKADQEQAEYEARKQAAFAAVNDKLGQEKEETKAVGRPGKFRTNDKIELTPRNSSLLKMLYHNNALGGKTKVGFVNDHIESLLNDLLAENPEFKDIYDQALEETLIAEAEWKKAQEEKRRKQAEERAERKRQEAGAELPLEDTEESPSEEVEEQPVMTAEQPLEAEEQSVATDAQMEA